ncbi:aldehyde dehydrogenase family protein, partial [Acinetobacter baumannii]|nr:aldehyde dehydrogenase family protein [Acinetobacter baumannii]
MLEQAHLEGTSTDTDFQQSEHQLPHLASYVYGTWHSSDEELRTVYHAITGESIYAVSSHGIDMKRVVQYAKQNGSELANWTFHQRANALKQIAQHLLERKEDFYKLAYATGATRKDAWIDIEGGIQTLFAYSSLVRRELNDEKIITEDSWIQLSKNGTFGAKHI